MKQNIILTILLLYACTNSKIMINEKFYGQYYSLVNHSIFLELKNPNYFYFMERNFKQSGYDNLVYISNDSGIFNIKDDSMQLISKTRQQNTIKILNENVLIVKNIVGFSNNDTLYCFIKYDKHGNPIFNGKWKNGKKDGDWLFFHKNYNEKVNYKDGIELKREVIK